MLKVLYLALSMLLLIYLLLPGPTKVEEFKSLPDSLKSTEPGDTIQQPNIAGYFTIYFRKDVIPFYKEDFKEKFKYFGISLPYIRLNHPPEYADKVIRPVIQSYYLEEFVHPLRESLFISGWEPYDERGRARFKFSHPINVEGRHFETKVNLRYYPSPVWARLLTWLGIVLAFPALFYMYREALKR